MFKKIASVSAVTAMLILGGCSSTGNDTKVAPNDTKVVPSIDAPTGSNAKLQDKLGEYNDGAGIKNSFDQAQGLGDENSLNDLGIDLSQFFPGDEGDDTLGAVTGEETDSCVNDEIATTESDTNATANGTITFTNCTLPNGTKINGSVTVDFSATGGEDNFDVEYSGSGHISVISGDGKAKVVVSEAKTEGKAEYKNGQGTAENQSGISAYLEDNGNKFLILDGINTEETNTWNDDGEAFTFKVSGYIGSDDVGMLKVETPVTIKGDNTHDCPTEGKVTLTDASNSVFTAKANGTSITTDIDGSNEHTYNCGGGSAGEPDDSE